MFYCVICRSGATLYLKYFDDLRFEIVLNFAELKLPSFQGKRERLMTQPLDLDLPCPESSTKHLI